MGRPGTLETLTTLAIASVALVGSVERGLAPTHDSTAARTADDSGVRASEAFGPDAKASSDLGATSDEAEAGLDSRNVGPFEIPFGDARTAFVLAPHSRAAPQRLIAMMHGVCMTPNYTCGSWARTASSYGFLVCPTGNTTCESGGRGGPNWDEPFADMDADLERSIKATQDTFPEQIDRSGAILAGFSRGAYMAVIFAVRHPGRWPLLILNEADVELSVPMMRSAGVRAVALIAGEWGAQIEGERKTFESLKSQGYPIRLWVMPKAGHFYSPDIESIMKEAIDFLLAHEHDG